MTEASSDRSHGKMPSDEQMDGLLRDFFRLEIPTELNQPLSRHRSGSNVATLLPIAPTVEIVTVAPKRRRVVVVSALSVLALSLVVIVQTQKLGDAGSAPVVDKSGNPTTPVDPAEDMMLVSPQGDQKASSTVGADGVTLEETDGVELKPRPRN